MRLTQIALARIFREELRMAEDEAVVRAKKEKDALEELTEAVRAQATGVRSRALPREGARGLPSLGLGVTGEIPNILSKEARHRLVRNLQIIGGILAGTVVLLAALMPLADSVLKGDEVSDIWIWPAMALVLLSTLLFVLAYFTVMGFGKVKIDWSVGTTDEGTGQQEGGQQEGGEPGGSGTADDQAAVGEPEG